MASYLERYQNGEYEQVWDELIRLEKEVRQESIVLDALAVAREMMRRVRKNIEVLIGRLTEIGFVFGYDYQLQHLLRPPFDVGQRGYYLNMFSWARQQPPVFLAAQQLEEALAYEQATVGEYFVNFEIEELRIGHMMAWKDLNPNLPQNMASYLDEIEGTLGPLPLSVRAWYEEVGAVNLYGYHAGWASLLGRSCQDPRQAAYRSGALMSWCDPLQVAPLDEAFMEAVRRQEPGSTLHHVFADDCYGKDYRSTGGTPYVFAIPHPYADSVLPGNTPPHFVQYLRQCFQWGGFPGMAEWPSAPKEDLDFLTRDLLPF